MKEFTTLQSKAAPLDMPNVDTDQIIPKQFLKRVERTGFGEFLFYDWRYDDDKKENKNFSLNKPQHQNAQILLARDNFGCGSSREHAPWALNDYGFWAIIAPSFADIFFNNCFQNGMLPVALPPAQVDLLFKTVEKDPQTMFRIDLAKQTIEFPAENKQQTVSFEIDAEKKYKLLHGLDDIGLTLKKSDFIKKYEDSRDFF